MTANSGERFPNRLALGAISAPTFKTRIVEVSSGYEESDSQWENARLRFRLVRKLRTLAEAEALISFFRRHKGRYLPFLVRDNSDYRAPSQDADGRFNVAGVGDGLPMAQLYKYYYPASGSHHELRLIEKPDDPIVIQYDGSPLTSPAPTVDYDTGGVTFGAFDSESVVDITPGATTDVELNAALSGLGIGELLYLSGVVGTIAPELNGLAHTITNIAGAVYTLDVDTTALVYTSGGTGVFYPQPTKTLRWTGTFHVPVRFGSDSLPLMRDGHNYHQTGDIELIEVRQDEDA